MLCMTLSHRINRIRGDPGPNTRELVERFYKHRGVTIRSLRESLDAESHYTAETRVAGIVSLLLADVSITKCVEHFRAVDGNASINQAQQAACLSWRSHADGAMKLIQMQGGLGAASSKEALQPQLLFLSL